MSKYSQYSPQPAKFIPFRKEFKIHPSIESKNESVFVRLARQIDSGVKKGYRENKIVDFVVQDVHKYQIHLYLEGRKELKLLSLRKILRPISRLSN